MEGPKVEGVYKDTDNPDNLYVVEHKCCPSSYFELTQLEFRNGRYLPVVHFSQTLTDDMWARLEEVTL